jgi:hypothetical protein
VVGIIVPLAWAVAGQQTSKQLARCFTSSRCAMAAVVGWKTYFDRQDAFAAAESDSPAPASVA